MAPKNTPEVVLAMINKQADGCWLWLGSKKRNGYGQVKMDGKMWLAHRLFYFLLRGAIPADLTVDHLCRNRLCVNPEPLGHCDE
jgi:hypothetical protein